MINLQAAGLNPTETRTYQVLLTQTSWQPTELAKNVGESRTNMYKILDKLVGLGLAEKFDVDKKLHYQAANPSRLIQLAREVREKRERAEKELEIHTQSLMRDYIKVHEQPGVTYFQGGKEISEIFDQIAGAKQEVLFIHTSAGVDYYGFKLMHNLRMKAVRNQVKRRALTPDTDMATVDYKTSDPLVLLERTWLKQDDYTAPAEWGVFDNKLYIISYGEDALGLVIESATIAEAFRQIFKLLERGQKLLPDYPALPKLAKRPGVVK